MVKIGRQKNRPNTFVSPAPVGWRKLAEKVYCKLLVGESPPAVGKTPVGKTPMGKTPVGKTPRSNFAARSIGVKNMPLLTLRYSRYARITLNNFI